MKNWISKIKYYLNTFIEVGVLLLAVSVIAEVIFGPNVAFFGSQVTENLVVIVSSQRETRLIGHLSRKYSNF